MGVKTKRNSWQNSAPPGPHLRPLEVPSVALGTQDRKREASVSGRHLPAYTRVRGGPWPQTPHQVTSAGVARAQTSGSCAPFWMGLDIAPSSTPPGKATPTPRAGSRARGAGGQEARRPSRRPLPLHLLTPGWAPSAAGHGVLTPPEVIPSSVHAAHVKWWALILSLDNCRCQTISRKYEP